MTEVSEKVFPLIRQVPEIFDTVSPTFIGAIAFIIDDAGGVRLAGNCKGGLVDEPLGP